ncbi:Ig-like domain-containing protein, partial [Vibrio fluvialis]|nr:Ig-like domain-containing protein [Vibrio fluvialis]
MGSTTLTASYGGVTSNEIIVTVTNALLRELQVTPGSVMLAKGFTKAMKAQGVYSDSSVQDVTSVVEWYSSDSAIANVSKAGEINALEKGTAKVYAFLDGVYSNESEVVVSDATLTGIQVTPADVRLPKGASETLQAIGAFSDGATFDITNEVSWVVADGRIATISGAELNAQDIGKTTLTANHAGVTSNTVTIETTAAEITSIQVTPSPLKGIAKGLKKSLTAMATFTDGTTQDITSTISWLSNDSSIATVSSLGELSAVSEGNTTVSGTKGGVVSNVVDVEVTSAIVQSLQITPPVLDLAKGVELPMAAMATMSDSTSMDVTTQVNWVSDNTSVATVLADGTVSAVGAGSAQIQANMDGVLSNVAQVNVSAAEITSIQVTPSPLKGIAKGLKKSLTAMATFTDGTTQDITSTISWLSNDSSIATVSSLGELAAVSEGNTTVSGTKGGVVSNVVDVEVTSAVVVDIELTGASTPIPKGLTEQLKATAIYSDGSRVDITSSVSYVSANTTVATITSGGVVSGVSEGNSDITASLSGVTSAPLLVT